MSAGTVLWELARPRTEADRSRFRRMAFAIAGSGTFLLAAFAIITLSVGRSASGTCSATECFIDPGSGSPAPVGLSDYLTEAGLRRGTAFGVLLMTIPFVLFAIQALRTGTAARERRLAALSLAGATRQDLRRLAVLEGTRAAVLGGLLAGPGYLLLWLILGVALPDGAKLLPPLTGWDVLAWVVLVLVMGAAGGLLAGRAARPAAVSPLGVTRRAPRPLTPADAVLPVLAVALIAVALIEPRLFHFSGPVGLRVGLVAGVVLGVSVGPWLILAVGRVAAERSELVTAMAGRRLLADVRTPGRVVGVMLAAGGALGVIAVLVVDILGDEYVTQRRFYLSGAGAAAVGALVVTLVAVSALTAAANEQILDSARSTAALVALAASPTFVTRIVRRTMLLAAMPATILGAVLGWAVYGWISVTADNSWQAIGAVLPAAIVVAAAAAALGAVVAARAVHPTIVSSSAPENLRAP